MLEHYCDALIIGTDLTGLITAAFLARRGLTVQVLDLNEHPLDEGDPDPSLVGHLQSKLLRSILGRLNIPENDISHISRSDSPLQIIFPHKRLDVSANPGVFYEELEREFPQCVETLKNFYENLVHVRHRVDVNQFYSLLLSQSFSERRALKKYIKAQQLDQKFHELELQSLPAEVVCFLMAQIKLITGSDIKDPFALQVAEVLNPNEGEVLALQGGQYKLKKLFLERVEHHEGGIRNNIQLNKLLFKNGIFEGASLMEGSNILARYVIWNDKLDRLKPFLPKLFRFRGLRKAIEQIKPRFHWYSATFEVPFNFIPPPMKENLLLIDDPQKSLEELNYLYVQIKNSQKPDRAKLIVNYLLPAESNEKPPSYFMRLHEQIRLRLAELLPFSDSDLILTYPLVKSVEDPTSLFPEANKDFEFFKQRALENAVCEQDQSSFSHLIPTSYKTPAPNFFLTSPEIMQPMGFEARFMLGMRVTDTIWNDVETGKKRAMKQERRMV